MSLVLFSGSIKFSRVEENKVIFEAETDEKITWGDDENNRLVEGTVFSLDKKFWDQLGSPDEIVIGFSTVEGWFEYQKRKVGEVDDG